LNIEEQRNELIKVIQRCLVFGHHILIDTGKIVFLFDIDQHYIFDIELLEKLRNDENYKDFFTKMIGKREARKHSEKLIKNIKLKDDIAKMRVFQYLIKNYNITYDISEKTNLVTLISMTGLMTFELETFGNEV
jgi:hypothetical protein